MTTSADVVIVGAGIVGLATARALHQARPGFRIVVLEKESEIGRHQTGHNSGVLHSGLYYKPGSHKARLCVEGRREMLAFCEEHGIEVAVAGKLVIASRPSQVRDLDVLHQRGTANGLVGLDRVGPSGIRDFEPNAVGVAALFVPEAGVTDYGEVARKLAGLEGWEVRTAQPVRSINSSPTGVEVQTSTERFTADFLINCGGLHADRIAWMAGLETDLQIVPFRGEYFTLTEPAARGVRSLIYPVPDPRFPFLGVHFTRRIDGSVEVGPNAILALGREHYRGTSPDWRDARQMATYRGLHRLAAKYWRTGVSELIRSKLRALYARSAAELVPGTRASELLTGGSGVRAQAVARDGTLMDDFVFLTRPRSLHVLNAPSPAATASLAIGRSIAGRALSELNGG